MCVEQWQQLEGEAIAEILVADTDLEQGAEAEEEFEEEEDEHQQQQQQTSALFKPQAATSCRLQTWRPPQERTTNMNPSFNLEKV